MSSLTQRNESFTAYDNSMSTPYIQNFSVELQREIVPNLTLEVRYVGTKGTHLYFGGAGSINYLGPWVENQSAAQIAQLNSFVPPFLYATQYLANGWSNIGAFVRRQFHVDEGRRVLLQSFYRSISEDCPVPISSIERLSQPAKTDP